MALPASQLQILIGMLPASQPGATHGSAALWLQACAGAHETLGSLGAVEALAGPRTDAGGGPDEPPDGAVIEAGVDEAMPLAENGTVDGVR